MNFKLIFKHYWKFLKKYTKSQVLILIGYGLGAIGTTVIVPLIYKRMVDVVSNQPLNAHEQLSQLVVFLIISIVVYNIFFRVSDYLLINSQSLIIKELYDYSLEKLENHSYSFFSNAFVGGLVAKTKRFAHAFEVLHDQFIFQIWMSGIALLSSLLVLWFQWWILGLAFLIWIILYSFLVRFMVKWQIPKSLANAEADTSTISRYADILSNILTVKMFGSDQRELENFKKVTDRQEKKRTSAWMQDGFWNGMIQSVTIGLFNIAIIWFVIDLWKNDIVSTGTIVLVQVYVITSFNIVWNLSKNIIRISSALSDADEMVKIFEREPEIKDPLNPEKLSVSKGEIEFKNVTFKYENSSPVFENLDLSIKAGEKVALVGHSGAGKTTIVKLLLRFSDVQGGSITIDGQKITQVAQEELRKKISYVPQDPSLFHRSLQENVSYANPQASFSEIVKVVEKAQAQDFIENLPKGYNSLVGERGIKLSGGERQRIAIARAMLKDSPIVVLDEATSSLDSLAEQKIQKALENLIRNKTTIVIAHRLSTIKRMDRIVVFDKGKIAEEGTHRSLLQKKGLYFKLWKSQVDGFIPQENHL
jgi:ATP-binding cassette, subfamily B, bacterial